ncbi:uncharacterized protein LOC134764314 [Penaeus indicus]|uniref:uncharacterized protein LOC134764314 n=1 Tax=Penaeus indicus TaxID=29960 RepID=UPI00300C5CA5
MFRENNELYLTSAEYKESEEEKYPTYFHGEKCENEDSDGSDSLYSQSVDSYPLPVASGILQGQSSDLDDRSVRVTRYSAYGIVLTCCNDFSSVYTIVTVLATFSEPLLSQRRLREFSTFAMGFRKKLRAFFRITRKQKALEYKAGASEPDKQSGPKSEQSKSEESKSEQSKSKQSKSEQSKSEQSKSEQSKSKKSQSEKSAESPSNVVGEKPGQVGMDERRVVSQEGGGEVKAKEEKVYMQQTLECDGHAAAPESVAAAAPPTYAESLASGGSSPTQSYKDLSEATSPTESNHVKFCNETCLTHSGTHERQRMRRACRQRKDNLSGIKVKYTKVYGENDGAYKNDSTPRGLVFMCNFSQFMNNRYSQRKGSEVDYYSMLDLFQQLGYGGGRRDEKYCLTGHITKNRFMERLRDFSVDSRHKMLCSCVIIIMSHGLGPKTFVTSDDKQVDLMEIYTMFNNINCEILRGKPKIFILQFCRNNSYMPSSRLRNVLPDCSPTESLRKIVREELHKILAEQTEDKAEAPPSPGISENVRRNSEPALMASEQQVHMRYEADTRLIAPQPAFGGVQKYSDMYSIFSTASGELSHRDPHKGSLLIQAICHVFAENAYQDEIDTLVRKVSTYMTKTLQKDDPITVPRVTCERTNNGLDKKFYFNPEEVHRCRHVTI